MPFPGSPSPSCWAEIDLSALRENVSNLASSVPSPTRIMAVVKADAYGHGLVPIARELWRQKVGALAVNSLEEGLEVRRRVSARLPVIVLLGLRSEEAAYFLDFNLTPVITSLPAARALNREAGIRGMTVRAHLKVDTGMGRLGVVWSELSHMLPALCRLKRVLITGVTSHLARADEPDEPYNRLQWRRFQQARQAVETCVGPLTENHLANSAAALYAPDTHLHFIRPGITLYGGSPDGDPLQARELGLRPVMTVKTRVLQVKQLPPRTGVSYGSTYRTSRAERIAVLPIGYANGYPRRLSNRAEVLIRGHRFPVVGRVCMSLLMVRLDPTTPCRAGDEAVLLGRQGREAIDGDTLARQAGTIAYELFCLLGRLNPRIYKNLKNERRTSNIEHRTSN